MEGGLVMRMPEFLSPSQLAGGSDPSGRAKSTRSDYSRAGNFVVVLILNSSKVVSLLRFLLAQKSAFSGCLALKPVRQSGALLIGTECPRTGGAVRRVCG
jgi:hypothetical protein